MWSSIFSLSLDLSSQLLANVLMPQAVQDSVVNSVLSILTPSAPGLLLCMTEPVQVCPCGMMAAEALCHQGHLSPAQVLCPSDGRAEAR